MSKKNKGTKRKLYRVAISGPTVDGRNIPANHIVEMAKNYDPNHYQARIWLEHLKSIWPDSEFSAYGDVLSLEAKEVEVGGETVMGLYAELSVSDRLKKLNEKNQKIFSSIEYHPNFRDKGYAYLTGLAATDTPASAGTEPMKFSFTKDEGAAFTGAIEMSLEDIVENASSAETNEDSKLVTVFTNFTESLKGLFSKKEDTETVAISNSLDQVLEVFTKDAEDRRALENQFNTQKAELETLRKEFNTLKSQLANEPVSTQTFTPVVELANPNDDGFGSSEY